VWNKRQSIPKQFKPIFNLKLSTKKFDETKVVNVKSMNSFTFGTKNVEEAPEQESIVKIKEPQVVTYILSELYNDSMLRKQSLKYITENIDEVTQNSDWDEYLKIYPQFFTNAIKRLCKKNF
jgi:hypothetical protein